MPRETLAVSGIRQTQVITAVQRVFVEAAVLKLSDFIRSCRTSVRSARTTDIIKQ